jgi:hypothetical protein
MKRASRVLALAVLWAAVAASCASNDGPSAAEIASAECLDQSGALYEQRIAPLLATDRPKTCNQCHLSGVDLNLFVRDDMCETRACLFELGLIDRQNPDDSLVLAWIRRAQPESDLITEQVIEEEYEGFREFVGQMAQCGGESCQGVRCPQTRPAAECGPADAPDGDPPVVPPDTGCDDLSLETAFRDTVYTWRDRCFPCHFTSEKFADLDAPRWIDVEGGCVAGSLKTFHNVVQGGYVNVDDPDRSFLLLKPLGRDNGGVEHGGGDKFHGTDDPSYVSFLSFLTHYAGCVNPSEND